jgi:hypothetical protein
MVLAVTAFGRRIQQHLIAGRSALLITAAHIDVGEQPIGSLVYADISVENAGGRELVLTNFRTSCSCAAVVSRVGDVNRSVESLTIAPKAKATLQAVIRVSGEPLNAMTTMIAFDTNDPDKPQAVITATVSRLIGGLVGYPRSVIVGTLAIDQEVEKHVDVFDTKAPGRPIRRVTCSDGRVTIAKIVDAKDIIAPSEHSYGVRVARLILRVSAAEPGDLNAVISIQTIDDSPTDVIYVVGRFVRGFDVTPHSVQLDDVPGKLDRFTVVIKRWDETKFEITSIRCPTGIHADLIPASSPTRAILAISRTNFAAGQTDENLIYIDALVNGQIEKLTVPVRRRSGE